MKYGSVCSGIEAATAAWHPLGWEPEFFSEIEAFPSAVLNHHYPEVPNLGDMTKFKEWPDADINVLVGGTPCQSFSVAGLRKGLDDPRGNLMLTFGAIAAKYRPEWLVWENVPGVLSANGGRDFGTFLGMLGQLGYGFAYRVLDAQYTGLAQRRKRVFVVGCLGDWRGAAAVLFERHSLSGDIAPSREAREETPQNTLCGLDVSCTGALTAALENKLGAPEVDAYTAIPWPAAVTSTLDTHFGDKMGLENQHINAGCPMFVPVAFGWQNSPSQGDSVSSHITPTLDKSKTPAVAFTQNQRNEVRALEVAGALAAEPGAKQQTYMQTGMQVRRLTPVEFERLQGFPDNYTAIPYRNKPASRCPDGPRYKALGNSMAVPVMRWIGERIQIVDDIYRAECEPVEAQA